jgi:glycosyltransferase involved in cell wall biosynthesis
VHVSPAYAPLVGGAERLLQSVSERLVQRGHDVTVLTFDCATMRDFHSRTGAGLPRDEVLNGVRIVRVNPVGGPVIRAQRWFGRQRGGWRVSSLFFGDDLWPLDQPSGPGTVLPLARLDADVITSVNWYFGTSFWVCRPRSLRRTPRVAIPVLHIECEWAYNPMLPRMLSDCDGVIVMTDAEGDFVADRGGHDIAVAGCGVDPNRFARRDGKAIRARYRIGNRPVVGFVGRQDPLKGVPTLIEAMHIVWQHSPDAVLLLAGQSAHRDKTVNAAIASLSPENRENVVLFDDFADSDLPSIMDACDVLALPSVEESFGLVMIEAWACNKPVIGADIPSTRCIIDAGVDGLIVKPFDAPDLAEKILELMGDPDKRARFGERGRQKVLSRYTWDRVTDAWEAAFRKAAAASRRSS